MAPTNKISTSSRRIPVSKLQADSFAPFGEVIQNPASHGALPRLESVVANQGTATKYLNASHLTNYYGLSQSCKLASPIINLFSCKPIHLVNRSGRQVLPVRVLERHPFTPQTFIPMGLDAKDKHSFYLVVVAPTLPLRSRHNDGEEMQPVYPLPPPKRRKSLKERLLGARPNPFTNDFSPSTTPASTMSAQPKPKGPGLPDLEHMRAFVARGDQAVTYGAGTWHSPMLVLGGKTVDFVVVQYANGVPSEDCQEIYLEAQPGDDGNVIEVDELTDGEMKLQAKL